jgi:hypothetical protein
MKVDCIIYLNAYGTILSTKHAFTRSDAVARDVKALEAEHNERIYAARSIVGHNGRQVALEILTPELLAASSEEPDEPSVVEYWRVLANTSRRPQYQKGEAVSKSLFYKAGTVLTPNVDPLEKAWNYLDGIGYRWNPGIDQDSPAPCVGDVFIVTYPGKDKKQSFAVAGAGFTPINLQY